MLSQELLLGPCHSCTIIERLLQTIILLFLCDWAQRRRIPGVWSGNKHISERFIVVTLHIKRCHSCYSYPDTEEVWIWQFVSINSLYNYLMKTSCCHYNDYIYSSDSSRSNTYNRLHFDKVVSCKRFVDKTQSLKKSIHAVSIEPMFPFKGTIQHSLVKAQKASVSTVKQRVNVFVPLRIIKKKRDTCVFNSQRNCHKRHI